MEVKELYTFEQTTGVKIPLYMMSVSAGIPVAVESEVDDVIDINEYLIDHPAATFFARVKGDSMTDIGIHDNDIVIFDTSVKPQDGKVVIALGNDELTVKIFRNMDGIDYLQSSNSQFLPIKIEPYLEFKILGVVTKVIHTL
ncbi:LexA family protein [Bacteroidota bacterium]